MNQLMGPRSGQKILAKDNNHTPLNKFLAPLSQGSKLGESHSQSLPTEYKDYLPSCLFDLHGQCIQISTTRLQNSSHHLLLCAQEDNSVMGHREAKQLRTQKPPAGAWQAERAVCQSSLAQAQHRHSPQGARQGSPAGLPTNPHPPNDKSYTFRSSENQKGKQPKLWLGAGLGCPHGFSHGETTWEEAEWEARSCNPSPWHRQLLCHQEGGFAKAHRTGRT